MHVLQAFRPHQPPHDVRATVVPKGPRLTRLSQRWAAAATSTLSVLCASGPACAAGELPDLPFALCWVPPLSAVDQTPSFLVVASTMLLIPNVSGSDGGHQVLEEGRRAERGRAGRWNGQGMERGGKWRKGEGRVRVERCRVC